MLDSIGPLYSTDIDVHVRESAPVSSYGRDRDIEWSDADQEWWIDGVGNPFEPMSLEKLVTEELHDLTSCSLTAEGEESEYRAYRVNEICDVVLLSTKKIENSTFDWVDIRGNAKEAAKKQKTKN